VEEVLVVQVEEAYGHQVVVVDIVDILVLQAVEDNFEEDIEDAHNVVLLVVDEDYKSAIQNALNKFRFMLINLYVLSSSTYITIFHRYFKHKKFKTEKIKCSYST